LPEKSETISTHAFFITARREYTRSLTVSLKIINEKYSTPTLAVLYIQGTGDDIS
jgi:hypothetical protein